MIDKIERCVECDEPTGKAGRNDDSLYLGDDGPFCDECYELAHLRANAERLAVEVCKLHTQNVMSKTKYGDDSMIHYGTALVYMDPDNKMICDVADWQPWWQLEQAWMVKEATWKQFVAKATMPLADHPLFILMTDAYGNCDMLYHDSEQAARAICDAAIKALGYEVE